MRSPTARKFGPRDGGFVVSGRATDGAAWWPAVPACVVSGLAWEREGAGLQRGQPLLRRKERRLAAGPWAECTFDGSLPDKDPLTAAFSSCLRSSASRNLRFTSSSAALRFRRGVPSALLPRLGIRHLSGNARRRPR